MAKFHIEVIDTYGGEANYCWKKDFIVTAKNFRGAICKLARSQGAGWKLESNYGDMARYNLSGACVCAFVNWIEESEIAEFFPSAVVI